MKFKSLLSTMALTATIGLGVSPAAQALDIAFDGFCDGMFINNGAELLAGGNRTGCAADPLIGNITYNVGSTPFPTPAIGINMHFSSGTSDWIYLLNYQTQQWCNYNATAGSIPVPFLCGTFSFGVPAVQGGAATTD